MVEKNKKNPNQSMLRRLENKIKKIPMVDRMMDQYMEQFATPAQKKAGKKNLKIFFSKGGSVRKKT
jgi:hypothetical protein